MRIFLKILMVLCLLAGYPGDVKATDPSVMLFDLAGALRNKDLPRLRELIDAQSMVYVRSILRVPGDHEKDPLAFLSYTANLDSFRRVEARLFDRLGNGMEQDECRNAWRSGCPWAPEAASNALLVAESGNTVICAVDNKRGIRTWLLLKKEAGNWRAWAIAESDKEARLIASQEFQDTLSKVRRELPGLVAAQAKARAADNRASEEEYKKRMAEIEERNRAEKAAKDAVACRVLRLSVEEREPHSQVAAPSFRVLLLTLEVHNANSFALLPKTWALTFSSSDGTQVKSVTLDHYRNKDNAPLAAGERKTLTLDLRHFDEKYIAGWDDGTYSAKAELLNFEKSKP